MARGCLGAEGCLATVSSSGAARFLVNKFGSGACKARLDDGLADDDDDREAGRCTGGRCRLEALAATVSSSGAARSLVDEFGSMAFKDGKVFARVVRVFLGAEGRLREVGRGVRVWGLV